MGGGVGENMTEANLYGVLTILATLFIIPIALAVEPVSAVKACIDSALASGLTSKYLWKMSLLSGAFYYFYNEVASPPSPLPHARTQPLPSPPSPIPHARTQPLPSPHA